MPEITIYTTQFCPYCVRAKQLLQSKGLTFNEIAIDGEPQLRAQMMADSGRHTVPQIWIGTSHVGGCDELMGLEYGGKLDALIAEQTKSAG